MCGRRQQGASVPNQDACHLLTQNPRLQNDHFHPIVVEGGPPRPQAQAGAAHTGVVVTPIPVRTVDKGAVQRPAAVLVQGQQQLPLQPPTLNEYAAMAV